MPASSIRRSRLFKQARNRYLTRMTDPVHIVGGGTKNAVLNQFTANACGCPVVTGPVEGTALGNVLIQARAMGEIGSLADIRKVVRASSEMNRYEPTDKDQWDAADARLAEMTGK